MGTGLVVALAVLGNGYTQRPSPNSCFLVGGKLWLSQGLPVTGCAPVMDEPALGPNHPLVAQPEVLWVCESVCDTGGTSEAAQGSAVMLWGSRGAPGGSLGTGSSQQQLLCQHTPGPTCKGKLFSQCPSRAGVLTWRGEDSGETLKLLPEGLRESWRGTGDKDGGTGHREWLKNDRGQGWMGSGEGTPGCEGRDSATGCPENREDTAHPGSWLEHGETSMMSIDSSHETLPLFVLSEFYLFRLKSILDKL